MKILVFTVVVLLAAFVLWYVSGVIALVGTGALVGFVAGMFAGSALNDWFETTWIYQRRQRKKMKVS